MDRNPAEATDRIRVLIVAVPGLLAAVIRNTVNGERDMGVVGQVESADELRGAVELPVDVVVTASATAELPPALQQLLFRPDPVPVVKLSVDGKRIDVYGRHSSRGVGLHGLTGLIRDAVCRSRE